MLEIKIKIIYFQIKKLIQDDVFVGKTLGSEESRTKVLFLSVIKDLKTFVSRSYAAKSSLILFMFFANMAAYVFIVYLRFKKL